MPLLESGITTQHDGAGIRPETEDTPLRGNGGSYASTFPLSVANNRHSMWSRINPCTYFDNMMARTDTCGKLVILGMLVTICSVPVMTAFFLLERFFGANPNNSTYSGDSHPRDLSMPSPSMRGM